MKHHGWAACLAAVSLVVPSLATAGSGYIEDGKLNVSAMFTYRETDIDSWRPLFDEASRLLFNATNGQLQLGTIRVTNCGYDNENADIWVLSDNSGAFANPLGLSGDGHIYISQTHRSVTSDVFGPFGLVHEFGHYAAGLYDEYNGVEITLRHEAGGTPGTDVAEQTDARLLPNQFCVTDLDQVACVMDGGTTILPNNGRTEFCTHADGPLSTAHNDGNEVGGSLYVNSQELLNGESCWETINRILGLESPNIVDTADPSGLDPIEWQIVSDVNRVVMCIDRSGSMWGTDLDLTKMAGMEMADLLHERKVITVDGTPVTLPGEEIAVVSFASDVTIDFPILEVIDQSTKDAVRTSVEAIEATGLTQLGPGLRASLDQITGQSANASCAEAIIVFTDGNDPIGEDPLDVVPDLQARGVKVFAISVGVGVNDPLLLQIATDTGGSLYDADGADDFPGIFAEILAAVRSGGTSNREAGTTSGENHTIGFLANGLGEEVSTVVHWDEGTLDFELTTPSGDVITVESAAGREDVEAVRREGFLYIRVVNPELGEWSGLLEPVEVPDVTDWEIVTLFQGRAVDLTVSTDKGEYTYPEQIHIRADVIGTVPVAGATVTGVIERPVSGPFEIELLDNGNPANGDDFANDGVYTAIFDRYPKTGLYTIRVTATNENGTGPDPSLPFVEDGADPPVSIPPFTREGQVSVYVRNVPPPRPSWLYFPGGSIQVGAGEALTAYLELLPPETVEDVILESVVLNEVVSPTELTIGDVNENGIPDLRVEFALEDVLVAVPPQMGALVELSGLMVDGETVFEQTGRINVIDPTDVVAVSPLPVVMGEPASLAWTTTEGPLVTYDGWLSEDGGATWHELFTDHVGLPEMEWLFTNGPTTEAQILIEARDPEMVRAHSISDVFEIVDTAVDVPTVPTVTRFHGVTPNPSRGGVVLEYSLADRANVNLDIYDVSGRLVRRLVSETVSTGSYRVAWDGRDAQGHTVSAGVYLYRFEAGSVRQTGRIMLMN